MTCYLIHITTCHAIFNTKHDTPDSYNYHDNGNVVLDSCYDYGYDYSYDYSYDSSYDIAHSRNLIIILISHKKDNLYGEWEEVMDAGMISCL